MKIEFFSMDDDPEVLLRDNNSISKLEERKDVTDIVFYIIKEQYSEAYNSLFSIYGKAWNFKFLAVRRFIKCNLSCHDSAIDLDGETLHFEKVPCPMRGECKWDGIICNPKLNNSLTEAEKRVYILLAENIEECAIADQLFLSINTVQAHRKSIYRKLKISSKAELILHHKNNII